MRSFIHDPILSVVCSLVFPENNATLIEPLAIALVRSTTLTPAATLRDLVAGQISTSFSCNRMMVLSWNNTSSKGDSRSRRVRLGSRKYYRYTRTDGALRQRIDKQTRSLDSKIISFEASDQSRDSCNWFLLFGQEFFWWRLRVHQRAQKKKPFGEMVNKAKHESFIDLMVYVMEGFNLLVPSEGGLLDKLKEVGLKVGK